RACGRLLVLTLEVDDVAIAMRALALAAEAHASLRQTDVWPASSLEQRRATLYFSARDQPPVDGVVATVVIDRHVAVLGGAALRLTVGAVSVATTPSTGGWSR